FNNKDSVTFDVDTRDLNLWLNQFDPVLLVIYDAQNDKAYWLDIQEYFKSITLSKKQKAQKSFRVHVSRTNKVNIRSMKKIAQIKNDRYNIVNSFI
ncbi:MAG: DUF4365 domain-containing protein, partial [Bacteroidota bacterium]|nr:DUF4365 domain-containing protein [Bacteroidota bacterium]